MTKVLPQPLPLLPSSDEIVAIIQRLNEEHCNVIDNIVQTVTPLTATFHNVLKPVAEIENIQSGQRHVIAALRYAAPELNTQRAVEEAEQMDLEYQASIFKRTDFLKLVQAIKAHGETLDGKDNRVLEKTLLGFTTSGFGVLDAEKLEEWDATSFEIGELCTEFNRNIREYKGEGGPYFTMEELVGIPEGDMVYFPPEEDGKRYVPISRREILLVLRHASSRDTRMRMQDACRDHISQNIPVFERAALLRDQNARLLGYGSYAKSVLSNCMATSVEWVAKLIQDLASHLESVGRKEFEAIRVKKHPHMSALTKSDLSIAEVQVEPWDVLYYRRMLEEERAIDDDRIEEYFPLEHTFKAILDLFAKYFQLRFHELSADGIIGHTWADDVSVWSVWDDKVEGGKSVIGYLYADLLQRPNKYRGNQAVRLQPGYVKSNGERVFPVCTIMCSFRTSVSNSCCLLEHSELRSLFHELGHCMHDLLARTKYQQFHGYNVCLEFGEAIGIMLENWAWMKEVLCALGCHYTRLDPNFSDEWKETHPGKDLPPEKISDLLLAPLLRSFKSTRAIQHLQQICDSMFDLTMHNPTSHNALQDLDSVTLYQKLQEKLLMVERPELGYLNTCHFHLMSGMATDYYAYISANVFAEELFQEAFSADHNSKTTWERFRREVLEHGGNLDEHGILKRFLGRPPEVSALLKRLGLEQ